MIQNILTTQSLLIASLCSSFSYAWSSWSRRRTVALRWPGRSSFSGSCWSYPGLCPRTCYTWWYRQGEPRQHRSETLCICLISSFMLHILLNRKIFFLRDLTYPILKALYYITQSYSNHPQPDILWSRSECHWSKK